jgi:hypothetical protein
MAGRRSPQGPSISQLTSPLDSITSCRWRLRHIEFQQKARRHLEHLGGTEDYLLAAALYEVALKRWPKARIQMREGARIVYDNKRSVVV